MKAHGWLMALGLAAALTLATLGLLAGQTLAARAAGGTLYVAPDGNDSKLCDSIPNRCRTLQRAVDLAVEGDTVKVTGGTYTDADTLSLGYLVAVSKTITLRGGYDAAFADPPDPVAFPTTLDAQGLGRVIRITADDSLPITPKIEGFVVTGGNATGLGGESDQDAGGGIYCSGAHPIITRNVITGNTCSSNNDVSGGGIFLYYCASAVVSNNTIAGNAGSTGGFGRGGGVNLTYSNRAIISGNRIVTNTASTAGTGFGGGVYLYQSDATISKNLLEDNVGTTSKREGNGGGIWIEYGAVIISHNIIRGNIATAPDQGIGGGVYVVCGDEITLDGNRITGNAAESGSGIAISQGSFVTLTNNIIARNHEAGWSADRGGALWFIAGDTYPTRGTLLHNTIADNVGGFGQGLSVGNYVTLDLANNIIAGQTIGIANSNPVSSIVTADHTLFAGNDTNYASGVTSSNELTGEPAFVAAQAENYHILSTSAAIDQGRDAGVTDDIDGDHRPLATGYDIGADEWHPPVPSGLAYLPLTLKSCAIP
jgi:hypothetical protein